MPPDRIIHQRLRERRFVAFIVAEAAIAPHVDHHVALEGGAELGRHLACEGHRLGAVAVHVQDRRLHHLRDIRRIRRGARELRGGGEAHLIVDHEMDAAAGIVTGEAGETEALHHDALARERRVAMDEDGHHPLARGVVELGLLGARLAEHHGVDRFEVARIRREAQVDEVAVEIAVGRRAEVIFDVTRSADVLRIGRSAGEFGEDRAIGLGHQVGEHVQPPAMRHADHDLGDAVLAAIFDDVLKRGDHRFAAVEPEALGADIFAAEELLPLLGLDHLGEDRLLPMSVNWIDFLRPSIRSWRKRRSSTSPICIYSRAKWPQ